MLRRYDVIDRLNKRQQMFCNILDGNVTDTEAYQLAYKCSKATARGNASRLKKNPKVRRELNPITRGKPKVWHCLDYKNDLAEKLGL